MRCSFLLALLAVCAASCSCGDSSAGDSSAGTTKTSANAENGQRLVLARCILCHQVDGRGGALGPPMNEALAKVAAFLPDYAGRAAKLQAANAAWYEKNKAAIQRIAAEPDLHARFASWLDVYLVDPKFDQPDGKMVAVPLTDSERADVVAWLMRQPPAR